MNGRQAVLRVYKLLQRQIDLYTGIETVGKFRLLSLVAGSGRLGMPRKTRPPTAGRDVAWKP